MDHSASRGQLKADAKVASDIGLADKIHEAELLPRRADSALDDRRDRHLSAHVLRKKKRAALFVVVRLDVVCKCVDVLLAGADFFETHLFSFLHFYCFDNFALAFCHGASDLHPLGFFRFAHLKFFLDGAGFRFQSVEIRFRSFCFRRDGGASLLQLVNAHVFQFHVQTSVKIRILWIWRSLSSRSSRSAFSASITPSK